MCRVLAAPEIWSETLSKFRRALITGSAGFVGQHLKPVLLEAMPNTNFLFTTRKNASSRNNCVSIDLVDCQSVHTLIKDFRPDLVIHLAAQSSVGASGVAAATWHNNVGGAIALAKAIACNVSNATVFNVSSAEVYGHSFRDGPASEKTPLRPASVYARTKAAAESVFSDILPATAKLITVRPFNHAGPGQDERFVVPSLAAQIAHIECGKQASPILVGNLDAERDFLDVRDVVRAYVELIAHSTFLPMRSIFNICSGCAIKISDMLSKLQALTRKNIQVDIDPSRIRTAEVPRAVGDASAIRTAIGWTPKMLIDQTLQDVLDEMRRHADMQLQERGGMSQEVKLRAHVI